MAWTETLTAIKGNLLLNAGSTSSGQVKTISQTIGQLNPATWNIDKVGAIASAMEEVLATSIYSIEGVKTYDIENK